MNKISKKKYYEVVGEIHKFELLLKDAEKKYKIAASNGDMSENAIADTMRSDIEMYARQISSKKATLTNSEISSEAMPEYTFILDGVKMTKTIEPENCGDYRESITDISPVGQLLLNSEIGDNLEFTDIIGKKHLIAVVMITG